MNRSRLALAIVATASLFFAHSVVYEATADDLVGVASVIDGDTLEVRGTRIRMHGIDAPESSQQCITTTDERVWRCGQQASLALADKIGRSPVTCRRTDTDHFGRTIAVCFKDGVDLNAWMVEEGWAVAYARYSRDYITHEARARASGKGIWSSRFVMPWDWRRGARIVSTGTVDGPRDPACVIKGNINRAGDKIYHVPGGRHYDDVRIDESRGQRWFCSEAEAQRAGWRRSAR